MKNHLIIRIITRLLYLINPINLKRICISSWLVDGRFLVIFGLGVIDQRLVSLNSWLVSKYTPHGLIIKYSYVLRINVIPFSEDRFKCDTCEFRCVTKHILKNHILRKHTERDAMRLGLISSRFLNISLS